jgi:hypothetical protein
MEYARVESSFFRSRVFGTSNGLPTITSRSRLHQSSWIGNSPVALISSFDLDELETNQDSVLFQFEVLDFDIARDRATIVRLDTAVPYYAYYRFERDVRAIANSLTWLGSWIVWLAQGWGWAYVPPGAIPSWRHLGKSRPPKRELAIDINVSMPDVFAEAMQTLEDRLTQIAMTNVIVAESFSERVSQVSRDVLQPLMQQLAEEEATERQGDETPLRHGLPEELFSLCLQVFDSSEDAIAANPHSDGNRIAYAVPNHTPIDPPVYTTRYISDGDGIPYPLIQPTLMNPLAYETRYIRVRAFAFENRMRWGWMPGHAGDRAEVVRQRYRQRRVWVDTAGENGEMVNVARDGGAGGGLIISIPGERLRGLEPFAFVRPTPQPQVPAACQGCKHYHGAVYNGIPLVCAMHPYGVEDEACADFENGDRPGYHCDFCGEWHD